MKKEATKDLGRPKSMDNRLDFFSILREYAETLTEDDALLVLSHNKKQGDCFTSLVGDWEILSVLFSQKGYVNFEEGNAEQFENIKKMILNTAYNICMTNEETKAKFIKGLQEPKELVLRADKKGYVDCPFCKEKHKHGIKGGNGNRIPDCTSLLIYNPVVRDGNVHYKSYGYYVAFD